MDYADRQATAANQADAQAREQREDGGMDSEHYDPFILAEITDFDVNDRKKGSFKELEYNDLNIAVDLVDGLTGDHTEDFGYAVTADGSPFSKGQIVRLRRTTTDDDRTIYEAVRTPDVYTHRKQFTSTQTWDHPAGVEKGMIVLVGGGGGGGGGGDLNSGSGSDDTGDPIAVSRADGAGNGGGGGGVLLQEIPPEEFVEGEEVTITIGSKGAGGALGNTTGGDGGDTTVSCTSWGTGRAYGGEGAYNRSQTGNSKTDGPEGGGVVQFPSISSNTFVLPLRGENGGLGQSGLITSVGGYSGGGIPRPGLGGRAGLNFDVSGGSYGRGGRGGYGGGASSANRAGVDGGLGYAVLMWRQVG